MLRDEQILSPAAYQDFFKHPKSEFLAAVRERLEQCLERNLHPERNYHIAGWKAHIAALPSDTAQPRDTARQPAGLMQPKCEGGVIVLGEPLDDSGLSAALRALMPWRKGPLRIFGVDIDSEWHSDWKWDRVLEHIQPLKGRRVLDIGAGNGYYLWRMYAEGADAVVGIEPHLLNIAQFSVIQRYAHELPVTLLPMQLEEYPINSRIYDSVFSMGVLYHRKSPVEHLLHCKSCLKEGGEFVLETLVVDGDENTVLSPEGRYAKMRNVWHIPSPAYLKRLLQKCGFKNPQCVNQTPSSPAEQRRTPWMTFESLADFLDPADPSKTIEGHPAPVRAIFTAEAG